MNTNSEIISKRAKSISRIKKEQVKDPDSDLRKRLNYYNNLKKVKIICIETNEVFNSRSEADRIVGHLKINTSKGILECEKIINGKLFHFKVVN